MHFKYIDKISNFFLTNRLSFVLVIALALLISVTSSQNVQVSGLGILWIDPETDQIEIENNTNESILTLYTCFPLWTSVKRLVVRAKLIDNF